MTTRHFALEDGGAACGQRAQLATFAYNTVTCRRCRRTDEWVGASERFDGRQKGDDDGQEYGHPRDARD